MISKNSFLRIPCLKLAGKIEPMTDRLFDSYVQTVNKFIDQFPGDAEKMSAACF